MSEIIGDENGHIIKPEQVQTAHEVPTDTAFIADLQSAVSYKLDKKTRESREFIKAQEQKNAENPVQNIENVSYETNQSPIKTIIGVGILIFVGLCGFKVWQNVKKSQ